MNRMILKTLFCLLMIFGFLIMALSTDNMVTSELYSALGLISVGGFYFINSKNSKLVKNN